jgi:hypothetical protein
MKKITAAQLSRKKIFRSSDQAGKGPDPRHVDHDLWYDAPIWKNFGPDSRTPKKDHDEKEKDA